MFHGPLTSFKRQGVIRLVFRFHLRRRKLSFMLESSTVLAISRIRLMDKSGPTRDIMVPWQPPDPFGCAPTLW